MSNIPFRLGDKMDLDIEEDFFDDNLVLDFEINSSTGVIQKRKDNLPGNREKKWDDFFWKNLSSESQWNFEGNEGNYLLNDPVFGEGSQKGVGYIWSKSKI